MLTTSIYAKRCDIFFIVKLYFVCQGRDHKTSTLVHIFYTNYGSQEFFFLGVHILFYLIKALVCTFFKQNKTQVQQYKVAWVFLVCV